MPANFICFAWPPFLRMRRFEQRAGATQAQRFPAMLQHLQLLCTSERVGKRVMAFEVGDAEGFEPGIETFAGQGAFRQQRGGQPRQIDPQSRLLRQIYAIRSG